MSSTIYASNFGLKDDNNNLLILSNVNGNLNINGGEIYGPTGPTGADGERGPTGFLSINGTNYGDYVYWNNITNSWQKDGNKIHIGTNAGLTGQNINTIAIGINAGGSNQLNSAIAIGLSSGRNNQQPRAISIGNSSGLINQQSDSIAIGNSAGNTNQSSNAIAIGNNAGNVNQGQYSIAIGYNAGQTSQPNNSIILNATGNILNGATGNALYIDPIRLYSGGAGNTGTLLYNTTTKEITYNTAKTFVIDHPTKPNNYLVHSCLEGPESGVYYRGISFIPENQDFVEVNLPDYVSSFTTEPTPHITSIYNGKVRTLSSSFIENNSFKVYGEPGPFTWIVYTKRQEINVEPLKSDVQVVGDGPYRYIR